MAEAAPVSLADAYPLEQERVRRIQANAREIAATDPHMYRGLTIYADLVIEPTLREAEAAAASGDVIRMLRAYQAMKEIKE